MRDLAASNDSSRQRAQSLLKRARAATSQDSRPPSKTGLGHVATSLSDMAASVLQADANWEDKYGVSNPFFGTRDGFSTNTIEREGVQWINFSGYNYLGLAHHPRTIGAAKAAVERFGTSASASRVASGELTIHRELEQSIANFLGVDDALVFNSGYGTNVSTIAHLLGPGDAIFHDELIHSSGLMGSMLSGAARVPFRHNDAQHLEAQLRSRRPQFARALILIESVYSMDGDVPELPAFLALCDQFDAEIMVDEAHSLGVLGKSGRGLAEHFGIDSSRVDIWMGTLSKTLASCGGYIAGKHALIEYCRYTSPGFVYSCGLSPADTASALEALAILKDEPGRVTQLRQNASTFLRLAREAGLNTGDCQVTGVVPWIVGQSNDAIQVADRMNKALINVQPVFYPTVEEGKARLRFFISSDHTEDEIKTTVATIQNIADELLQNPQGHPRE